MSDCLVADDMPEIVTPEHRRTCLEALEYITELQDEVLTLRAELNEVRQERNDLINEVFRLRKIIHGFCARPVRRRPLYLGKPTLTIVKNEATP